MKRLSIFAALAASIVLVGCGASPPSAPSPPRPAGTLNLAPAACQQAGPPCSAIVPEGARGKDMSRYVAGTPPLTLIGGQIQLDTFGAELTGGFENVPERVYCPYWDPYGHVWTRGYGETDWSGNFGGRCITKAQALANLRYLMDTQYLAPVRRLGVNLSHKQVDALGDLAWNVGPGDICCTLASLVRAHAWYSAAIYIRRYSYAGGSFLQGLYDRRVREGELLQVVERPAPAPTHAQLEAQLAGHERELAALRRQIVHLRTKLASHDCYPALKAHRAGPKCRGWKAAGNRVSAHGRVEDAQIAKLRRDLA